MDENMQGVSTEAVEAVGPTAETEQVANKDIGEKLSLRNFFTYPLGTFGRDFLYNFFNGYLLNFVLLTKNLTTAQFSMITVIIICARIFDAFNDPIMGSIVENTRTKWGKYKPWQLIGAVLTGFVIIAIFNVPLTGWAFIGFLAFGYFMFSITFTMNDISYWGMMPSLTTNADDRNKLNSFTQLVVSAGGGLAGLLTPMLTAGDVAQKAFGGAVKGYGVLAILVAVLMVASQLITIFGVKEKPLPVDFQKVPRMKFKDLFKVIFKNDQLLWNALVMLLWAILSGAVIGGGLLNFFVYLEFSYNGTLLTVFGIGMAVLSVLFTLLFPILAKKFGRNKMLYSTGFAVIIGYVLMLIIGLAFPDDIIAFTIPLDVPLVISVKFILMMLCYTLAGWGSGFYMIMLINMANTVEYNEWKTGKRDEALIFSLRPLTAKLGSAIAQGLVSLSLIISGALVYTNKISELENLGTTTNQNMTAEISDVISKVSQQTKMGLIACMCVIPIVLMTIALILYKLKCKLDEKTMEKMLIEIEEHKAAEEEKSSEEGQAETPEPEEGADVRLVGALAADDVSETSQTDEPTADEEDPKAQECAEPVAEDQTPEDSDPEHSIVKDVADNVVELAHDVAETFKEGAESFVDDLNNLADDVSLPDLTDIADDYDSDLE